MSKYRREDIKFAVLHILADYRGEANRISRPLFMDKVAYKLDTVANDYFDRLVRKVIEELRKTHKTGCWIVSVQERGGGYFMAETTEELEKFLHVEESRGITVITGVQMQRKMAGQDAPDQMPLPLGVA